MHTYGLMVAIGFLAAFFVAKREFPRHGLSTDFLDTVILMLMVSSLLGARIFYFAVDGFRALAQNPFSFFKIWEGGLVFYGGFIGGLLFLFFYTRYKEVSLLTVTDSFAAPLLLGQAIGRLGCLAAGCCYGRPTELPWKVTFTHPEALAPRFMALHPTQLYEAGFNALLFAGIFFFRDRFAQKGMNTIYYLVGYGVVRFLVEFIRSDDRGIFFLHLYPSQWISIVMILIGVGLYVKRNSYR